MAFSCAESAAKVVVGEEEINWLLPEIAAALCRLYYAVEFFCMFSGKVLYGMSIHISASEMEQFCTRTLEVTKTVAMSEHLTACANCQEIFQETIQKRNDYAPVVIDLSSEKWLRDEHLDYEWLIAYVDGAMENDEREMTEIHLKLCRSCDEEVNDFIAWQRDFEPELKIRYFPQESIKSDGRALDWQRWFRLQPKPGLAFVGILITSAAIVLSLIRPQTNFIKLPKPQTNQPSITVQIPPPPEHNRVTPPMPDATPKAVSNRPPAPQRPKSEHVTTTKVRLRLTDKNRTVTLDRTGRLSGLEGLPLELQDTVAVVLSSEKIMRPLALNELTAPQSNLRGESMTSVVKLLTPRGVVIADDQPTFRWEQVSGAASYRIYVSDAHSHKIADSGLLPPSKSEWSPALPLKRGEVYSWVVGVLINGEEILSPSVSAPEVKFRVLSATMVRKLNQLKQTANSHLVLGVFYAQAGMITEAEREFQLLVNLNPDSSLPPRLLRLVQTWK